MGELPAGLGIIDWYNHASILLATGELTVTFGISNIYVQILILVVSIVPTRRRLQARRRRTVRGVPPGTR